MLQVILSVADYIECCRLYWVLQIILSVAGYIECCRLYWVLQVYIGCFRIYWVLQAMFGCCRLYWVLPCAHGWWLWHDQHSNDSNPLQRSLFRHGFPAQVSICCSKWRWVSLLRGLLLFRSELAELTFNLHIHLPTLSLQSSSNQALALLIELPSWPSCSCATMHSDLAIETINYQLYDRDRPWTIL